MSLMSTWLSGLRVVAALAISGALAIGMALMVLRPEPARTPAPLSVLAGEHRCHAELRKRSVAFERLTPDRMPDIRLPIHLQGALSGVAVRSGAGADHNDLMDCRLARALLRWVPDLKRAGVVRVDHYSMYRRNSRKRRTGHISAHAYGMAIDVARLHLSDGTVLSVLDDWGSRRRGSDPCSFKLFEGQHARRMRYVFCQAAERQLFNVILTPHYDGDHQNHVHLELAVDRDRFQIL